MIRLFLLTTFLLCRSFAQESLDEPHTFRNFKLIRISPDNDDTLQYLKALYEGSSPYELDFWQPPTKIGGIVDVTVGPSDAPIFVKDLDSKRLNYVVALNDLEQAIANERSPAAFYHPEAGGFSYDKYNSLDDIHNELKRLKKEKPDMVTLIDIGQSHENRTLLVIKLSGRRSLGGGKRLSFWLDAGIHAREWIAPATAMYILHELVHGYESNPAIQNILDHIDFYILPVMNPDGYEYSRTKNRMWRKNRRAATCKRQHFHTVCCAGVDLNRNFDWFWAATGSSNDPCHETYHGPGAFSEPETLAVKDYLEANPPQAFISLHSYSQLWLIPFAHRKRSYPQDFHTALRPLALRATKAIFDLYGTKYQVGTGADLMYEASGGSHDWAKGSLKVPYTYLIELRPKNTLMGYGFLLPEREIPATGLETFEAIKVVADEIIGQFGQPKIREKLEKGSGVQTFRPKVYKVIDTTTPAPITQPTPGEETTIETPGPESTTVDVPTPPPSTQVPVYLTSRRAGFLPRNPMNTSVIPEISSTQALTTTPEYSTSHLPKTSVTPEVPSVTTTILNMILPTRQPSNKAIIEPPVDGLKCIDFGSYCRLWGILRLCDRPSISKLCTRTCNPDCFV